MRTMLCLAALLSVGLAFAQGAPPAAPAAPAAPTAPEAPKMNLHLLLPPEIAAVPGRELSIYFDNLILAPKALDRFMFDVDCAKGTQQEERYTWVPKPEETGVYPWALKIYDLDGNLVAEGSTKLHVFPADAGAAKPVTLLIMGDSLTNANVYPTELYDLCVGDANPKVTLLGTNNPNTARPEVKHEGYGGWRAETFCTMWADDIWSKEGRRTRSPFLFEKGGKPDFKRYCDEQNGGKGPDVVTILLGCNDNFGAKDDNIEASIDTFEKYMEVLIAQIHGVRPDTKIGVVSLMPPAATQDAFGANYFCGQTRWQYRKNQHRVLERSFAKFMNREAENVFFVPAYVGLDAVNNYPIAKGPANSRSDQQIGRLNNGVHPAGPGYKQLADSLYCWLKGMLAQ
jgi:lysophospholipase L1-like esterase